MNELWIKLFIAIFCPLVVAFLIALVRGYVELRDSKLDHDRKLKTDADDIDELQDQIKNLKERYGKDRAEHNTLMTMATSIDTKIDAKLKDVLMALGEQRREDSERLTKIITDQNKQFSNAISELNNTLGKINVKLDYFDRDLKDMKGQK